MTRVLPEFKVWDAINSDEMGADTIQASDPYEAAQLYAERDVDGNIDGIYVRGFPVMVRESDGTLHKLTVTVEYDPVYHVSKA